MHSYRLRILVSVIVCAVAVVCLVGGCSDNPQNKAAKELRAATEEAMALAERGSRLELRPDDETYEVVTSEVFADARAKLNAALSKASVAGTDASSAAYLAGGNLYFAQVRCLRKELDDFADPVSDEIDRLSLMCRKVVNLEAEQAELVQMSAAADEEKAKLVELIEGGVEKQGLKADLAAAEAQLKKLESERAGWLAKQQVAQDRAGQIQKLADEKLQAAELSHGDEKVRLQKAAYDLLNSRVGPLGEAQQAEDHAVILQSRINTLLPTVVKLREDVASILAKIDDLSNSLEREQLKAQAEEVGAQINGFNVQAAKVVVAMKEAVAAYTAAVSEIQTLLDSAIADYAKVRSRSLSSGGKTRTAECNYWKASVGSGEVAFRQHVGSRLESIAAAVEGDLSTMLSDAAAEYLKVDQEVGKAIMEGYDKAIAEYDASGGGSSDTDALSNHALALYGKMTFAERLGDYDAADAALDAADKLLLAVKDSNPAFMNTVAARLISGNNDFIPPMAVDMTAQYDELRKQFQSWKSLRGDEARMRVEELLVMLDEMKPPLDASEFDQERAAMEAALEKGFDNVDVNDPNNLY